MLRHTIMLMIIAMTAACAEDEAPIKPTPDPFAGCSHDVLASDEVFDPAQGPAVNAQGELIVPAGAVIATTYIALKPGDEAIGALQTLAGPVFNDLMARPGLLAVGGASSPSCRASRTLTVWESEAAMMDFVMGDAHMAAIQRTGELSRGGSVTMSWGDEPAGALTWPRIVDRLRQHDGPRY